MHFLILGKFGYYLYYLSIICGYWWTTYVRCSIRIFSLLRLVFSLISLLCLIFWKAVVIISELLQIFENFSSTILLAGWLSLHNGHFVGSLRLFTGSSVVFAATDVSGRLLQCGGLVLSYFWQFRHWYARFYILIYIINI